MNGIKLFERIKEVSTFKELLSSINNDSKRGKAFEIVSNIIIRFGFIPMFTNDKYDHYEGNINTSQLSKVNDLNLYLKKLTSSKSGSSDITLQNKTTGEYVFISCKFCADDSKNDIKYYEVQDIRSAIFKHIHKYKQYKIYLFINNKQKVQRLIDMSEKTNKHLKDDITDIIGLDDLELYFQNMKPYINDIHIDEVNNKFNNTKIPLILRFHQNLITHQLMRMIDDGNKKLLIGAKARSGKTYCVGGLLTKYYKKHNVLNALIITPAPTETMSQFTEDLFYKFTDFIGINIIEIKKSGDFQTMTLQKNNIIIVSKQLIDDYVNKKKITSIKKLKLNCIIFDENHFHGTTPKSIDILESYSSSKTFKLFLTATYAKPLREWAILEHCQFYWDIEDEQLCKNRDLDGLIRKHGDDVRLFINADNMNYHLAIYDKMPDLHIITNIMDRSRYDVISKRISSTNYGFSNGTLLSTTKNGDSFNYTYEVDTILQYISGSNKTDEPENPIRDNKSIFERIKSIANATNSRTKLTNGNFTSQLWFLPFGIDMLIDKVSECLRDRMLKNRVLCQYEIMIVNSKKTYKVRDIKKEINNRELKAKQEGKVGLIILAGNQLTLGITLPLVDIVILLNDISSSDKIVQMMYRCMTETIATDEIASINNGTKKIGFVVDLNISRVLNTASEYNVSTKQLSIEQKIKYLIDNNLINIDADLFRNKENKSDLINELLNIWKLNPINSLKMLLKKIENDIINVDTTDQKLINQYFANKIGEGRANIKVHFDEDNKKPLQSGKIITKEFNGDNVVEDSFIEEKDDDISLNKDVLQFIIPLSCILTIKDNKYDFIEMLNTIKKDPALLEVFNDQSFIWWNKKDIIELIKKIVDKYIKRDSPIYNIAIQFKMSLHSLIDHPKELLELIDSCLRPKQLEKQKFGEVFTPMHIVNEMLDILPSHVWNNKHLKWLDPASGMGNFPVAVYLRLMKGLEDEFKDSNERKRHILENMLYMSELNKKNVLICRQIFDINNEYELNLYQGDSLELDTENEWKVCEFDIIMGNPPYNKGGIRSHTGKYLGDRNETIWTKFVEKSFRLLKSEGYLIFIHPLSWLKKSHSLHVAILEKYIIWLKLWNNSQAKIMINGCIPISLYVLQNTPNTQHKKTKIISEIKRTNLITASTEYLNSIHSIPLACHSIFNKLLLFIETHNCNLEYSIKTIKSFGTKVRLPLVYTKEDNWAVDTYTIKDGIMVKKTNEQHLDMNKRKLIIANKASFTGAFIDEGKLSLTGNHKFYILGDHLELILKLLSFKIINVVGHYTKYGQDFLDNDAFKYLPDIRKLGIVDITEDEFYKLIGFTEQEINQIKHS